MPEFNTIEEARAEILRLNEELATRTTERDNYADKASKLEKDNESVRELNQQYFLKLSAQYKPNTENEDEDDEDEDVLSCEDFAKTLTI